MYEDDELMPVDEFKGNEFVRDFHPYLDVYINLRAHGRSSRAALRASFGDGYADSVMAHAYIERIECLNYYINNFPIVLGEIKSSALWSPRIAAAGLLALANDPAVKCSTRMSAIKELNTIFDVTFTDEKGNTRSTGRSFNDFYRDVEGAEGHAPAKQVKPHPEPGTPEADALLDAIGTRH